MESDIANIWWQFTPEFVKHYIEHVMKRDGVEISGVITHIVDQLIQEGRTFPTRPDGGRSYIGSGNVSGSYQDYQRTLLGMVSRAPLDEGEGKADLHIVLDIPQDADNFAYMQRIIDITKGVLSFVNVRITFIGFNLSMVTLDLR